MDNKMNIFFRVGLVLDIVSVMVFILKLIFHGSNIFIAIQMGFFIPGVTLIIIGIIKMRQGQYEKNKS